ncbi:nucleoside-triphosphatase [Longibaculum muris]|uniref:nucleoside-triphosphatase n=1 Tax=Longibaculum muris TaxID=1796628 RepID=UPI0012B8A3DA|nr:nucleoside-triphosphatase [Longibaculum muris]
MMNILITGKRHIGKSTLRQHIIETLQLDCVGFQTIQNENVGIGWTYQFVDIKTKERQPISFYDGLKIQGIPETFSTLGVQCLKNALYASEDYVLMDELGRFERHNQDFIACVHDLLSSSKTVLAVIKDEPIPYLNEIKKRTDCCLYDLNTISFEEAFQAIIFQLQKEGRMK